MRFRPCIDLHQGVVKQIVGSTLENGRDTPETNFASTERSAADFAASISFARWCAIQRPRTSFDWSRPSSATRASPSSIISRSCFGGLAGAEDDVPRVPELIEGFLVHVAGVSRLDPLGSQTHLEEEIAPLAPHQGVERTAGSEEASTAVVSAVLIVSVAIVIFVDLIILLIIFF